MVFQGSPASTRRRRAQRRVGRRQPLPRRGRSLSFRVTILSWTATSEDESIGTELPFTSDNVAKFSSNVNPIIKSMLKPRELLTPEYHSLCDDLSNLILLSSSRQTWAKHCSAWKLYSEFCSIFRVSFDLPIKTESARAFVTWAASTKNLRSNTIRSYVSSLNMANTLGSSNYSNLSSDSCVKLARREKLSRSNFCGQAVANPYDLWSSHNSWAQNKWA